MTRQVTTDKSARSGKNTRVPVATRNKAIAKRSGSGKATAAAASRRKARVDDGARHAMIAQAAYFRAERRGFANGSELNDWLEAEREIARMLES